MRDEMRDEDSTTTVWRGLLTGTDPTLLKMRARWRHVPSSPRCKVCASPFHGIGGAFARVFWHGPMPKGLGPPPVERDVEIAGRIGSLSVVATRSTLEPVG